LKKFIENNHLNFEKTLLHNLTILYMTMMKQNAMIRRNNSLRNK